MSCNSWDGFAEFIWGETRECRTREQTSRPPHLEGIYITARKFGRTGGGIKTKRFALHICRVRPHFQPKLLIAMQPQSSKNPTVQIFRDGNFKAMVFPVVMYGCESWTIKKAEHWRIDAFELWCWRRLLRDPTNPSWRKSVLHIHWKDWCWSWNSNTLATWCEELTHLKRPWCWERLKAGGEVDAKGWDG